jgi:mRNA-degrading endonuclease toxin of MazEF toxin-antitoxin module
MYVAPVAKKAILRRVGRLTADEMRDVSERVVTSLELDISGLLSRP